MRCYSCDREIGEDEEYYTTLGQDTICKDCYEDHYFTCERCGGIEHNEDSFCVNTYDHQNYEQHEEYWCRGCMEQSSFYCEHCDTRYDEETVDSYSTEGGGLICDGCRDDYCSCANCGTLVYCDDMYYIDDYDEDGYCYNCYERLSERRRDRMFTRVCGYHTRPNPMDYFYGQGEEPTQPFKGFGIELEVDDGNGYNDEMARDLHEIVGRHLYYNDDGSLSNGFEIISQPHTEKALYELNWREILRTLIQNGYTSHNNGNCGLHMHISRAFFGDTEEERTDNIAKMVMFYELFWEDIRRFSRRTNSQVDSWAHRYCYNERPTEQRCKDIVGNRSRNGRYYAVNNCNANTVEFRIMRGTLKYSTFMATLDFLITTAKNSKCIDWQNINDKEQWLDGLKDNTIEYMRTRGCFGYSNNQPVEDNDEDDN